MRRSPPFRIALIAVMLLGAPACTVRQPVHSLPDEATLRVTNRGRDDVRVYLLRNATSLVVGTVSARSTRDFALSPAMTGAGELRLHARALSARASVSSELLLIERGDAVRWEIAADLGLSALNRE